MLNKPHELQNDAHKPMQTYFGEKIDLEASGFVGFGLTIVQIISHRQNKLKKNKQMDVKENRHCYFLMTEQINESNLQNLC